MKKSGFTLIEVLIVIVVTAILAVIVIPQLLAAGREAGESALKDRLQEMRNAIRLFHAECGDFPAKLEDLVATTAPAKGGNGKAISVNDFREPYLPNANGELPMNPFSGGGNMVGTDREWIYTPTNGNVRAKSGIAQNGTDYS
ncbi:type II secretion system GspH family protein, partial [Patescibacteria group bacterium]|nr:type II secretion system GspH family protein [Patescibacteria group bacterium]